MARFLKNLGEILYKDSIFEVLKISSRELNRYRNQTLFENTVYGIQSQLIVLCKRVLISLPLVYGISKQPKSSVSVSFWKAVIIGPLIEEIFFRGIEQNSIRYIQTFLPTPLSSAAIRIILTSTLFALPHLDNGGIYLTSIQATVQALLLILYPTESVIYEQTNSIIVSCIAHITSNFCVLMLSKVFSYLFK